VTTDNLTLSGQSEINSATQNQSLGNGGSITIQGLAGPADSVTIDDVGSGIFTDTVGAGAGGDIFVNASLVAMTNGSGVSSSSTGTGNAGNIMINAGNLFTMTNSSVTTAATQSSGGAIKITTDPNGTVQLTNSTISASVADGPGGGGNISIDPQYVILQNSQILAQAAQGQGGAITIIITNGGLYLPDANSIVNADSGSGVNGTVTIQSPNAPISGQIQPLGKSPLIATSLLNQHCAAVAGGQFSSFTVAGRDSLPTEPGSWLASPLAFATRSEGSGLGTKAEGGKAEGERLEGMSASAGQGARGESLFSSSGFFRASNQRNETNQIHQMDQIVLSLRQIAPAGFLTQAFAVEGLTSCKS
jgi:large exoprotein involved in heme utilization and adhesion